LGGVVAKNTNREMKNLTMMAPQMLNKMKGHYDSFSRLKTIKTKTNKNPLISCNR
jgi:hypothetical protein